MTGATEKQASSRHIIDDVLTFWLDDVGSKRWYDSDSALDAEITEKFGAAWEAARAGRYRSWLDCAKGALAYIILLDQFPRNTFRGSGQAFATDAKALAAAKNAIDHHWDMKIDGPARQFFYMPLMHSENLCDQERCVRMMKERMPEQGGSNLLHAKVHRRIIRDFGRFPYRNDALGRSTTPPERAFIEGSGYGGVLREVQAAAAAKA